MFVVKYNNTNILVDFRRQDAEALRAFLQYSVDGSGDIVCQLFAALDAWLPPMDNPEESHEEKRE
jgi:hypothetical protein